MARVTVEDCLEKVHNRFALVLLVTKRAKLILKGDTPIVYSPDNKQVVTALREVAEGAVFFNVDESEMTMTEQIQADLNS